MLTKCSLRKRGDLLVLERFALHDVAPVAGRVADAQEDGLVLLARLGEGLLAPRKPVHRVVLVLEQVGRFLPRQAVRIGRRSGGGYGSHNVIRFGSGGFLGTCGPTHSASQRQGSCRAPIHSAHHNLQRR